jgi:crossover junction endodeoxyribonuclease RuvC
VADERRAVGAGRPSVTTNSRDGLRVLGIDTSLRSTGAAVVEARGNRLCAVEYATLKAPARHRISQCLLLIHSRLTEIIERTQPAAAAIEGAFFSRNANTAMILGQARGVAIAVCAAHQVPVYEYAPRRVKKAIVGFGDAGKEQVGKMVTSLLGLAEEPREDEADALALAICHLNSRTSYAALAPEEI